MASRTGTRARRRTKSRLETREPIVLAISHEFGAKLATAFATDPQLQNNFEVVAVKTDNANGRPGDRPVWSGDRDSKEMRTLVTSEVNRHCKEGRFPKDLIVSTRRYSDEEMCEILDETGATKLISATYHGIFGRSVLSRVDGFNFHPSIWTPDLGVADPSELPQFIPERYQGKHAGHTILEDLESGEFAGAVVALHQLVEEVDQGLVFAWSHCAQVTLDPPVISTRIAEAEQKRLWAARMSNFQRTVAPYVQGLACKALPYLLGADVPKPRDVLSRRRIQKTLEAA